MTEARLSEHTKQIFSIGKQQHKTGSNSMLFTVTTTVLSVTACFNQMRSVNFNSETTKLVILWRQAFGQQ